MSSQNGTLEAIDCPSVDELDQQVAHFEASGIWELLPALSSRVIASAEVVVLLAGANEERRIKSRKSSQHVRFSPTCTCDDCPDPHSYEHSREVRRAAMTNY